MLEARLGKLAGVQSAKVRGYDRESKFYFNLRISENQPVLPETIRAMLEQLKKETRGDEDYPYKSFDITSIPGTLEKSGETWSLIARGSKLKYDLVPNEALKKLVEAGKSQVAVAGKLTDQDKRLRLEITEPTESGN